MNEETPIFEQASFTINVTCPFCGKIHQCKEVEDFTCDCGAEIKIAGGWYVEAWSK